jgi:glycosyltransferase involved in cell wall biosynthesis
MIKPVRRREVLVCIPCFNSQGEIEQVIKPLLRYSHADLLLIDDHSDEPLEDFVQQRFPRDTHRITVLRPETKAYSGGGKNIGIRKALEQQYRIVILMDSDVITPGRLVRRIRQYFQENPRDVVVAPAILPYGSCFQYADTLINFSSYLPETTREVSRRNCLAGYAFALNVDVFRRNPCFHIPRFGGDDVLFIRTLMKNFGLIDLPVLNSVPVLHQPPRSTLKTVLAAQKRYGRAFFTHNDQRREYVFNKLPLLHLLTPRFCLMMARLLRRRRFRDLAYAPLCWCIDFTRALQIVRLSLAGYRDAARATIDHAGQVESCRFGATQEIS